MEVAIHGAGYVGLSAGVAFAQAGHEVTVFDPDPGVVAAVTHGEPKGGHFLEYLGNPVRDLVASGRLRATTDRVQVAPCLRHIVAVPTEKDDEPHDTIIAEVLTWLYLVTGPGTLVCVESTMTPGLLDRLLPLFRDPDKMLGTDWFLAACPRRDWFADSTRNLQTLPRVVGGVTERCTAMAAEFLGAVSKEILTTTYRTAELVKPLENALLHVPVVFAHQLAWALPSYDVAEALRLAGTHWRIMPMYLGFGTGGRCIPVATKYLLEATDWHLGIGRDVVHWERTFRQAVAASVFRRLDPGERVAVLGISYRPGFRDAGSSPGLAITKALLAEGVPVEVHDPMWTAEELRQMSGAEMISPDDPEWLHGFRAVLLATPHEEYLGLPLREHIWRSGQFVLDAQGAWNGCRKLFDRYGVEYARVGDPGWLGKEA